LHELIPPIAQAPRQYLHNFHNSNLHEGTIFTNNYRNPLLKTTKKKGLGLVI